jgi:hypothetical protein
VRDEVLVLGPMGCYPKGRRMISMLAGRSYLGVLMIAWASSLGACGSAEPSPAPSTAPGDDVLQASAVSWVETGSPSTDTALETPPSADAMVLARWVRAVGPETILNGLGEDQTVERQLAATEASPWLPNAVEALAYLAPLAAGRDSVLAPAAAHAARSIAEMVDADVLARAEWLPETLVHMRAAYAAMAADASIRADLRLYASIVAERLSQAGVVDAAE